MMNNQIVEDKTPEEDFEEEFVCSICLDLMFQPVTTKCGHTFCRACLKKALGVKRECTICRDPIADDGSLPVNITLQKIIEKKYPDITSKFRAKNEQLQRQEAAKL